MADQDHRAKRADYMRAWERARGAEPIKGEAFTCELCKIAHPKTGHSQRWCSGCKPEGVRLYKNAQRHATGTVAIGATLICKHCGAPFTKTQKRQSYCPPCSALSEQNGMPHVRDAQRAYQSARQKRLYRDSPAFAINARMSAQIRAALREQKAGRKWEALVGYTVLDLTLHLERQFLPGMSWENRDAWHIDHILPLASFDFSRNAAETVLIAWALSNLRPLWKGDNIRKSASRTHLI